MTVGELVTALAGLDPSTPVYFMNEEHYRSFLARPARIYTTGEVDLDDYGRGRDIPPGVVIEGDGKDDRA